MQENLLAVYLSQIRRYKRLSHQEELSLARRVLEGDQQARQMLINANLRLVVSIAERYSSDEHLLMDLIQEGSMGLMAAVSKFSPLHGVRFSTYAVPWITQYILRYIQCCVPAIYIPQRKNEQLRRIRKYITYLQDMLGRVPSVSDLAVFLDVPESSIRKAFGPQFACFSMHAEISGTEGLTCGDMLEDERTSVEQTCLKSLEAEEICGLVNLLPDRMRTVIYYRYFFYRGRGKPLTFKQISLRIGCSAETVRQLERRALNILRTATRE